MIAEMMLIITSIMSHPLIYLHINNILNSNKSSRMGGGLMYVVHIKINNPLFTHR